jgi:hypothetical protein
MPFSLAPENTSQTWSAYSLWPAVGFRNRLPFLPAPHFVELIELAIPSNEPWPIRVPPIQLSWMNRMIDAWSVTV